MRDHLVICGLGHVGFRILELLDTLGEPCAVIAREVRSEWRESVEAKALCVVEGDARAESCLRAAGIANARAALIVTDSDLTNIEIALDIQRLNPNCALILRVFDRHLADRIQREKGVCNVLSPALLTAPVFVAAAQSGEKMRVFSLGKTQIHIARLATTDAKSGAGQPIQTFCAAHNLIPLEIGRIEGGPSLSGKVPGTTTLAAGDNLVVAASREALEALHPAGPSASGRRKPAPRVRPNVLKALRAYLPVPLRLWNHASLKLRAAFLSLSSLLLFSVLVFRYAYPKPLSWIDAFYFTVTIMTTVGFGDYNLQHAPWWLKLYGSLLMLAGAALIAITFGIVTDFIVSERVAQALGRQQSELTEHIVVIGLGDVGTRIVEELSQARERIVVIERDPEHEAVEPLQDHIDIILGDATREQTLRRANIPRARAVIVTTTSDTDSLRIAHLAEKLNPKIRSVVRIYDSVLAAKLGAGLGVERMVNAAATAAATFTACALQTDVEQGFTLGRRLLALRWMQPKEVEKRGLVGMTVSALAVQGIAVTLRRFAEGEPFQTQTVLPTDIVRPGEALLLLEEYDPGLHRFTTPRLAFLNTPDEAA